jgi:hypothetical protein
MNNDLSQLRIVWGNSSTKRYIQGGVAQETNYLY